MKVRQHRAFSLTELLVGLAVFGLLAALIVGVFTLAQRYSRLNQQVSRAQRNVTQALQRLSFDLRRSYHPSLGPSVSNVDQCRMLSWQPQLSYDPSTGQPLYATWVAYWRSPNGELRRSQRPLSGGPLTTLQINLSLAPTMAMMQSASDQRKVLDSISYFRIDRQDRLAQIELESRTSTPGNPDTHYRTTTCIPLE